VFCSSLNAVDTHSVWINLYTFVGTLVMGCHLTKSRLTERVMNTEQNMVSKT